jgi:hypothetical protein
MPRPTLLAAWTCWLLSAAAAVTIIFAPLAPWWGERHDAHERKQTLDLQPGREIGQSFHAEQTILTTLVVRLDPSRALPERGSLVAVIATDRDRRTISIPFTDVPPSHIVALAINPPLMARMKSRATFMLHTEDASDPVYLSFQSDGGKFSDGDLIHYLPKYHGDLAFQLGYLRPAMGTFGLQAVYALLICLAGGAVGWAFLQPPGRLALSRRDVYLALACAAAGILWMCAFTLRSGSWIGPGDFTKDAAYIAGAAAAVRQAAWPVWQHITCGGMLLLGNPEGNTLSPATLLGLVLPAQQALLLLQALEAGIGAAGAYVLSRHLGIAARGSIAAAFIYLLSPVTVYKLAEGYSMLSGAAAYAPWALLAVYLAVRDRSSRWAVWAGVCLATIFLRGDVHVIVVLILLIAAWMAWQAITRRSRQPLVLLALTLSAFFLSASPKLLAYAEQTQTVARNLHAYVAPLISGGLINQVFFQVVDPEITVKVLHGEYGEKFGAFGSYIGYPALILAVIGLSRRRAFRPYIIFGLIISFAIAEGTIFELWLRHAGIVGILLRLPSRALMLTVLFVALAAGVGVERVSDIPWLRRRPGLARVAALAVGLAVTADLALASSSVLQASFWHWNTTRLPAPAVPTLAVQKNASPGDRQHAGVLLVSGYLLPQICGDQNNQPDFTKHITSTRPVADVPLRQAPNSLTVLPAKSPADIIIRERFIPAWQSDAGTAIGDPDGSIHLLVPSHTEGPIRLSISSSLTAAAGILFLMYAALSFLVFV